MPSFDDTKDAEFRVISRHSRTKQDNEVARLVEIEKRDEPRINNHLYTSTIEMISRNDTCVCPSQETGFINITYPSKTSLQPARS